MHPLDRGLSIRRASQCRELKSLFSIAKNCIFQEADEHFLIFIDAYAIAGQESAAQGISAAIPIL